MAENIVNGKKYKVLQNGIWNILSFFTKASDVEFEDGMNAEEKIQDIEKNGFGIEITQAEYDALSEEEKNNGTYWITDGSGGAGGGGGGSINVIDNLESTSIDSALSANMGRELNEKLSTAIFIKSFNSSTGTLETVSADRI